MKMIPSRSSFRDSSAEQEQLDLAGAEKVDFELLAFVRAEVYIEGTGKVIAARGDDIHCERVTCIRVEVAPGLVDRLHQGRIAAQRRQRFLEHFHSRHVDEPLLDIEEPVLIRPGRAATASADGHVHRTRELGPRHDEKYQRGIGTRRGLKGRKD